MADTYDEPPAKRANVDTQAAQISNHRSSSGSSADSNVTLWQFLLDLLLKQQYSNIICWTNNDGEFKLLDAEQVAKLWGLKKNKHNMNYDKLSRALRYYYDKNIIKKVMGQKFVYKFVSFPEMVKTENRIPFKKKMESIVNESATSSQTPATVANASSFQTLRPYDVKSGIIQQAQLAAVTAHNQLMAQQQANLIAFEEQRRQRERLAVNTSTDGVYIKTEAVSPGQYQPRITPPPGLPSKFKVDEEDSSNQHSPPMSQSGLLSAPSSQPTDLSMRRPSPACTPLSVCTPASSPAPPVFDMPSSGTPTPPPKLSTNNQRDADAEVKVKLEIPELDVPEEDRNSYRVPVDRNYEPPAKRTLKHSKSKPDPISISNDVTASGPVVHSPLTNRNLLPSLNTPMFLTSPLLGSRTPLLPGLHFWPPGTLSPVATLSPRLPGFPGATAFQFPSFAVSPATLASFSALSDSVFGNSNANTPTPTDKKLS